MAGQDFDEIRCEACDELMVNCQCTHPTIIVDESDTNKPYVADENGNIHEAATAAIRHGLKTKQAELVARREGYRIEALRAASRIVAGEKSNTLGGGRTPADIIGLAEHFAKYLETGERS